MTLKRQIIFASAITLASILAPHLDVADVHSIETHNKNESSQPIAFEPYLIKTGALH